MPEKFNINKLMNEHTKKGGGDAFAFKIEHIELEQIEPSVLNLYSVDDIAELKASIGLVGLQQNLLVRQRESGGKYEIISGHRRYKALLELHNEGKEGYSRAPCKIIKSIDDVQTELELIFANATARRLTDYEISYQAERLRVLLQELQKSGYKFTGKKREIIAELLNVSPSQVARYESINKNLSSELTDEFKKGNINVTTAYEASRLGSTQQAEALEEHKTGATLTTETVKQKREAAKKPPVPPKPSPTREELEAKRTRGENSNKKTIDNHNASMQKSWEGIMQEATIEPCPFCGCTDIEPVAYPARYRFECLNKKCGASMGDAPNAEAAILRWNTRV